MGGKRHSPTLLVNEIDKSCLKGYLAACFKILNVSSLYPNSFTSRTRSYRNHDLCKHTQTLPTHLHVPIHIRSMFLIDYYIYKYDIC